MTQGKSLSITTKEGAIQKAARFEPIEYQCDPRTQNLEKRKLTIPTWSLSRGNWETLGHVSSITYNQYLVEPFQESPWILCVQFLKRSILLTLRTATYFSLWNVLLSLSTQRGPEGNENGIIPKNPLVRKAKLNTAGFKKKFRKVHHSPRITKEGE